MTTSKKKRQNRSMKIEDLQCGKVADLLRNGVPLSIALRQCSLKAAVFRRWRKQSSNLSSLHKLWDRYSLTLGSADAVHATLREAIISGALRPGDSLGEEFLSNEFNISRTPVREALMRLRAEHLAVRVSPKGLTVRTISEREVLDFYMMRAVLDGLAAKLAATRATHAEVLNLRWLNDRMQSAPDLVTQHDFGVQFHLTLFQVSHNRLLQQFGNEMLDWQRGFSSSTFSLQGRLSKAHCAHVEIIDAIEEHDEKKAEALAYSHMEIAHEVRTEELGMNVNLKHEHGDS